MGSSRIRVRVFPPEARERLLTWPNLGQRRRLVQPAVLHDPPNARRVPDVAQRVAIEHLQIGLLADLDRPDVGFDANRLRGHDRGGAEDVVIRHASHAVAPELPVYAKPLSVSM